MKKIYIAIALVATVCSCNKTNTPAYVAGNEVITFGTISPSKAFIETVDSTFIKDDTVGFNVVALQSDSRAVIIDNKNAKHYAEVTEDGIVDYYKTYDKDYYYPMGNTVDFYAVYPSMPLTVGASDVTLDGYESTGEEDLVAAITAGVSGGRATLTFQHILSRLTVSLQGTDTNVDYKLDSCGISFNKSGNYTFAAVAANTDWTVETCDTASIELPMEITTDTAVRDTVFNDIAVIPGDVNVAVKWSVYDKNTGSLIQSYNVKASTPFNANIGKKSEIVCKLHNSNVEPITFSIVVNPWEDEAPQEYEFGL